MASESSRLSVLALAACVAAFTPMDASPAHAAPGTVLHEVRLGDFAGGFGGPLRDHDWFGFAVDSLGDFDDDGTPDLAVGAGFDDDGEIDAGAVWILLLNPDGTVKRQQKISSLAGGFTGELDAGDVFGRAVATLGDLDGDGTTDLAVGSRQDDDGGRDRGAVWILFLNDDGTVKRHQKISATQGGLSPAPADGSWFGIAVSRIGDVDDDGVTDLVVGQIFESGGKLWILFLNDDGTVKNTRVIPGSSIGATDLIGEAVAGIGDIDGDGTPDIAATEFEDDDGGPEQGAAWVVRLNPDGSVKGATKISETAGGFTGNLDAYDHLGSAIEGVGDLDGDGTPDIAVGADLDDDGGVNRGAVWLMFLEPDGSVRSHAKISETKGGFGGTLEDEDRFGRAVTTMGDVDGDGMADLAVGTIFDDGDGVNRGAVWMTFLESSPVGTTTTTLPPFCGDGRVNPGEQCDDGDFLDGDGCSGDCLCEPGFDGDSDGRPDLCDPCPADPDDDGDGDGRCADVDPCPEDPADDTDDDGLCANADNCDSDANADQADGDGDGDGDACDRCPGADDHDDLDIDGLPDACDPCTSVGGAQAIDQKVSGWFRRIRLGGPAGNETFDFTGEFYLPDGFDFAAIDPLGTAVRVLVERSDGTAVIDATLPTAASGSGAGGGWKNAGGGSRWMFIDTSGSAPGGLRRIRLEDRSLYGAGRTRVFLRGRDGAYSLPFGTEPFRVTVVVGDATAGQCGETDFTARECTFFKGHTSLLCER